MAKLAQAMATESPGHDKGKAWVMARMVRP